MTIKTWKVWGAGLTALYIIGKDVDEVLEQARLINPNYNSVQLYSKEELYNDIFSHITKRTRKMVEKIR